MEAEPAQVPKEVILKIGGLFWLAVHPREVLDPKVLLRVRNVVLVALEKARRAK